MRAAVIASVGSCEVRLVETLLPGQPPESARLRVELRDGTYESAIDEMSCQDLQEAEAATAWFLDEARRLAADAGRSPPWASRPRLVSDLPRKAASLPDVGAAQPAVTLMPVSVATGCADTEGFLALADCRLVAVLVRLTGDVHGRDFAGAWFLEAGFGRCSPGCHRVFGTLASAQAWLEGRLSERD